MVSTFLATVDPVAIQSTSTGQFRISSLISMSRTRKDQVPAFAGPYNSCNRCNPLLPPADHAVPVEVLNLTPFLDVGSSTSLDDLR